MIPLVIHHVWPGTDAFRYADWRLSWMKHHPDADFRFWRRAESGMPSALFCLLDDPRYSPVVKSDVLRWAVLYCRGGIYADTDMECLAPLTPFLNDPKGCFVANEDDEFVCTALIAATPQHPFVKRVLDATLTAIGSGRVTPEEANASPNVITGPHLVTRLAKEHAAEITRHPYDRFYPVHYGHRVAASLKDAVTNHHWAHEWKGPTARRMLIKPATRFRIAIAHAAYRPERVASLKPMLAQLRRECDELASVELACEEPVVFSSWQAESHDVWARRIWTWATKQSCPVLVLNDDVHLAPGFVRAVRALLAAAPPGKILSLHAQGLEVRALLERGVRWVRMPWLTGPAYVIPDAATARQWLTFWAANEECRHQKEDGIVALWMKHVGVDTLACLPALVQHRIDVPSTYAGNDECANRQSTVPWDAFPNVDLLTWPSPESAAFVVPTAPVLATPVPVPAPAPVLAPVPIVAAPSRPARTLPPPKTSIKKTRFGGIYRR